MKLWNSWQQSLLQLSSVEIQRCLKINIEGEMDNIQLHSFSDASRSGYGSMCYLRLRYTRGRVNVTFLVGKSRLTPIKQVTIPRLDLTAAVVAIKLTQQVEHELELRVDSITNWTDSTVVLQ